MKETERKSHLAPPCTDRANDPFPRFEATLLVPELFRLACLTTLSCFPFPSFLPLRRFEYSFPPHSPQSLVHHASHSFTTLYTSLTLEPRSSTLFTLTTTYQIHL